MKEALRLNVPPVLLSGLERLLRCSTRSAWVMRLMLPLAPPAPPLLLDVVGVKLRRRRTRFKI